MDPESCMATKSFVLTKESHVPQIGDDLKLRFVPEVYGDESLDGYTEFIAAQKALDGEDLTNVPAVIEQLQEFLASFTLPESAKNVRGDQVPDPPQDEAAGVVPVNAGGASPQSGLARRGFVVPRRSRSRLAGEHEPKWSLSGPHRGKASTLPHCEELHRDKDPAYMQVKRLT